MWIENIRSDNNLVRNKIEKIKVQKEVYLGYNAGGRHKFVNYLKDNFSRKQDFRYICNILLEDTTLELVELTESSNCEKNTCKYVIRGPLEEYLDFWNSVEQKYPNIKLSVLEIKADSSGVNIVGKASYN